MKIFVVSLKDSPRRVNIENQMKRLNIDFEFFDALEGRNGGFKAYEHLIDFKAIRKSVGRDLTGGEIGCALSHKFLYDKIVNENIAHTVILEDDAIIDEDFKNVLSSRFLEREESSCRFLGASNVEVRESSKQPFFMKYVWYKPLLPPWSSYAYCVDLETALILKTLRKTITSVADDWAGINCKILYPRLVCHPPYESPHSEIGHERFNINNDRRNKFIKMLVKLFFHERNRHLSFFGSIFWGLKRIINLHYRLSMLFFHERNRHLSFFGSIFWGLKRIWYRKDIKMLYTKIDGKY